MSNDPVSLWIIFPNQLFPWEELQRQLSQKFAPGKIQFMMVEEPLYFGSPDRVLNFNKQKLVFHRASMKYYQKYLEDKLRENTEFEGKRSRVDFLEWSILRSRDDYPLQKEVSHIWVWDPVDHKVMKKLDQIAENANITLQIFENPSFLFSNQELGEEFGNGESGNKMRYQHSQFYD